MDKDSLFTHHLTSPFLQCSRRKGAKEWGDYLKVKSCLWSLVWCLTNVNSSFRYLKRNPAIVEAEFFHQWRCEELGLENWSRGRQRFLEEAETLTKNTLSNKKTWTEAVENSCKGKTAMPGGRSEQKKENDWTDTRKRRGVMEAEPRRRCDRGVTHFFIWTTSTVTLHYVGPKHRTTQKQ